ncbi:MAG TPA: protein phosphatase CheZ [Kaistiaceae bacterium]|nr:protein phosphatase CheZ [Kaistiaceae bacterium]
MIKMDEARVEKLAGYLRDRRIKDRSVGDVMALAEIMAEALQDFMQTFDQTLYHELGEIGREIAEMKTEIGRLRPGEIRSAHIPEAGRELDAIVEATEAATHTIMEAAEVIMEADGSDADAYKNLVDARVIEIFEACSFQDITGQRIGKVVETLQAIDERISRLTDRLSVADFVDAEPSEEECAREKRKRELILHGPQHKGEGVSQDDVDAMFGPASQDDIDKLFD